MCCIALHGARHAMGAARTWAERATGQARPRTATPTRRQAQVLRGAEGEGAKAWRARKLQELSRCRPGLQVLKAHITMWNPLSFPRCTAHTHARVPKHTNAHTHTSSPPSTLHGPSAPRPSCWGAGRNLQSRLQKAPRSRGRGGWGWARGEVRQRRRSSRVPAEQSRALPHASPAPRHATIAAAYAARQVPLNARTAGNRFAARACQAALGVGAVHATLRDWSRPRSCRTCAWPGGPHTVERSQPATLCVRGALAPIKPLPWCVPMAAAYYPRAAPPCCWEQQQQQRPTTQLPSP